MTPRFAGSLEIMLPGMAPAEGSPIIRAMGFEAVEHCFPYKRPPEEIRDVLMRNGLEPSLIYTPSSIPPNGWGFACIPGREDEHLESVAAAIDYAQRVGCKMIGTLSGEIPLGEDRARYEETLVANLGRAATLVKKAGMVISLEAISAMRAPRFAVNSMDDGARVIAAVGDDTVGMCFDLFQMALERGSVIATAKQHRDIINYIQINNPPDRLGPGLGELDLPKFLEEILPDTKARFIGCEYHLAKDQIDNPSSVMAWAGRFVDAGLVRW